MQKIQSLRPDLALWIAIFITLAVGFSFGRYTFDLQLHDTYFIFAQWQLALLFSFCMGILSLGYWVAIRMKVSLINILSWTHTLVTTVACLLVQGILLLLSLKISAPAIFYGDFMSQGLSVLILLFLLFQPLFLLNLIIGFRRRDR
ncbi:hypothetical protein WJR50_21040 [Catalinimonas sp. 4WD22]|uniref:hypothetical protein n=1 Tax=Catalinimonas locisalis TaxID=3133978 RepID=UPI003101A18B